ncbi:ubiquinone biosynthesis protein COQ9-A, mitochondrial-like [Watersipora subatra]|uniref:ubiquinone biosynthesis protein COQ9-A, mitochondrial-like n=1 Tax=Watersipora subatra TaxID=2589382 RepID=UPI00355B0F5C
MTVLKKFWRVGSLRLFQSAFLCRNCSSSAHSPDLDTIKRDILDHSISHVPALGWTHECIIQGAIDYGYSSSAHGLFPRGGADLALHFYDKSNKAVIDSMETKRAEASNAGDEPVHISSGKLVRDAIEARIRMTSEYRDSWPQAMALLSSPAIAADSLHLLSTLMDDIWYEAGDRSHDMNWYSKRASLAFIYKTTELFMLQDKSHDFEETWKFLDRRFEDVGMVGGTISAVGDIASGFMQGGYRSLWTVMKNMAGIFPR